MGLLGRIGERRTAHSGRLLSSGRPANWAFVKVAARARRVAVVICIILCCYFMFFLLRLLLSSNECRGLQLILLERLAGQAMQDEEEKKERLGMKKSG